MQLAYGFLVRGLAGYLIDITIKILIVLAG